MAIDPQSWGIEHWSLAIALLGLAFALAQPLSLLLEWRQYSEQRIAQDPVLRSEWAARLRSGSAGAVYHRALTGALTWLNRAFGAPSSFNAWAVCFLIAMGYAYGRRCIALFPILLVFQCDRTRYRLDTDGFAVLYYFAAT
jgi:hypothetical protein